MSHQEQKVSTMSEYSPSDRYFATIGALLDRLHAEQTPAIQEAAQMCATCIGADGVVHVFGSGHSHMMAEEVFHRAGGLMAFNAMLDINLTLFGTLNAGLVERAEGYAAVLLESFGVRPGEVVIVVSNSGINPVPIELAIHARELGASVIAITSASSYREIPSRHSTGLKLTDVADLVIDSVVPRGDAIIDLPGLDTPLGAASTVLGAAIMNALVVEVGADLLAAGRQPPVIVSQNIPSGDERNRAVMDHYRPRLTLLKG